MAGKGLGENLRELQEWLLTHDYDMMYPEDMPCPEELAEQAETMRHILQTLVVAFNDPNCGHYDRSLAIKDALSFLGGYHD